MSSDKSKGTDLMKKEKAKKALVFGGLVILFLASMYLIFAPTDADKDKEALQSGLNVNIPQATDNKLTDDKQKAYEFSSDEKLGKKLLLPVDTTVSKTFPDPIDAPIEVEVVDSSAIPADMEGLDIGTKTQALFADAVKTAKTVVWNGPMGVFENPTLAKGTIAVAKALAETDATTIIGGGDSAAAVIQLGFADKMSHISTGGGASLEYLEGKVLPGIAVIADKN